MAFTIERPGAPLAGGDRALGMLCSAASYPTYRSRADLGQSSSLSSTPGALRPLRPHQERALENTRLSLASGHRRTMVQAPTGFGKTLTAAHIIRRARAKGNRVAFVVPALSLIDQTVAAFEAEGIDGIGVMQGNHPRTDPTAMVQVCSVQTVKRRKRPEVDLVIVDEAHELHREIFKWMADCPDLIFIGLSATPWARGFGRYYDDLIITATTKDLIEKEYLSSVKVYALSQPDLAGVSTVAGDFHEGQLAEAVDRPALVGDVIENWLARGENRPTLCYGVNRAHAEHLQQRFLEAGVAAEFVDCFTDRAERERILDRFRAGETKIICNVSTLAVGIDLRMVACIIDARLTKSEMRFVQTIGRGLRTTPAKTDPLVFDHAGNHLGLVTDIHHDKLDSGERRKTSDKKTERGEPPPRLCDCCRAVLPCRTVTCPECGTRHQAPTDIDHKDGELVELGSGQSSRYAHAIVDMAAFLGELKWVAREHGYAPGWAAHKLREGFGDWPNDSRIKCASASPPSLKTRGWIKSRQIAFAKARAAHG
jgi:DNA repair protein RadD